MKDLSIRKIYQGLKDKEFSSKEVTQSYLDTIREKESDIDAFLEVYIEKALQDAQEADEYLASGGEQNYLTGVPIAIKDNILIKGERATAGSRSLENYTATYDAGVIKKLTDTHSVFLGKTNLDEFAMGTSTENSGFKITKNPHDLERVPGGSSGGSAAAVASDMAPVALGSDTGGSIRQPGHFTGTVGFKPTYGAVSRSGLIALASSLDQIGPITKTVEDAAMIYSVLSGKDPYDNTSQDFSYNFGEYNESELKNLTIGIPKEYFIDGIEPDVRSSVEQAIEFYKSLGIKTKEISLPHTEYALSCYYILMPAEASSNLARFDGIRYSNVDGVERETLSEIYKKNKSLGFGKEVKRRVILGTFVLSSGYYDAYYKKALDVREYIKEDFKKAFQEVDAILTPTAPAKAFKIGEKINDPLQMYLEDIFTVSVNLAGLPGISIPTKQQGLPIGFQLIGNYFKDKDILDLGRLYEDRS